MDRPVPNESSFILEGDDVIEAFTENGPNSGGTGDTGGGPRGETSDADEDYCDEDGAHYVAYLLRGDESPRPAMPIFVQTLEAGEGGKPAGPICLTKWINVLILL